ncbi:MAG: hypothetical protein ACHQX3_01685 [Nitrospirales bacterium]|jgi:hypothetical protein
MADMYDQPDPGTENPGSENPGPSDEKSEDSGETFLVPKSALGGKETTPGTRCEFEVVHEYEDEVEFKYLPHGENKESGMERADAALDKMMGAEEE